MLPYELTDLPNRELALVRRLASRRDREIDEVLGWFAEVIRRGEELKAERDELEAKLDALQDSLGRGGRRPFGEKPGERETVEEILRLVGIGHSFGEVARRLNEAGRLTQTGKQWRAQQVKNVVRSESPAATG